MLDSVLRSAAYLLEPVGLLWLGVIWAALWALRRRQAALAVFLALLALGISVAGSTGLPDALLERLERPYAGRDLQALPVCDAVVVLGGGARPSRYDVGGLDLTAAGDRLVMGAELLRRGKARHLVVGGGAHTVQGQQLVEGDLTRQWLRTLGLASVPVISLGRCNHTRDEAVKVATLCRERGWTNVLLVTSASHMKRAEAVFRTAGVPVVAVPCDFQTAVSVMTETERVWVPAVAGFQKLSLYVHEQLGWWAYRWRGWIASATPTPSPAAPHQPPPDRHAVTASAVP
jgi:uncharacterized SAM-binding protein YcdF (DUF218 family)